MSIDWEEGKVLALPAEKKKSRKFDGPLGEGSVDQSTNPQAPNPHSR